MKRSRLDGRHGVFLICLLATACTQPSSRSRTPWEAPTQAPGPSRSCFTFLDPDRSLAECKVLANHGNGDAAIEVGDYYRSRRQDSREAVYWYDKAVALGNSSPLRWLFHAYTSGFEIPRNTARADEYLMKGVRARQDWALLVQAARLEKTEPQKAADLYLQAARNDNCFAQARLARGYADGDLVGTNLTEAYFWVLLAKAGGVRRGAESSSSSTTEPCFIAQDASAKMLQIRLERTLPSEFIRLAQDAATNWRKGQAEPMLPTPPALAIAPPPPTRQPAPRSIEPPPTIPPPKVAPSPAPEPPPRQTTPLMMSRWTPLPVMIRRPPLSAAKEAATVFEFASRSVWVVVAARSEADLDAQIFSLGSAVAVTKTHLLTNCHVIRDRPVVWVKQATMAWRTTIEVIDLALDRCVLTVSDEVLTPVQGMRRYEDLRVGEDVYSIGSPRGLESTLGQGIISGLREVKGQRLVQTTAPISSGSSGGGLFDRSGNLVGVTTFKLRESEGLNFAISVDDYFR